MGTATISVNDCLLIIGEKEAQNYLLRQENARLMQAGRALVAELDALKAPKSEVKKVDKVE